jgi:hypothetical protein
MKWGKAGNEKDGKMFAGGRDGGIEKGLDDDDDEPGRWVV